MAIKFSDTPDDAIDGLLSVSRRIIESARLDVSVLIDLEFAVMDVEHHLENIPIGGIEELLK